MKETNVILRYYFSQEIPTAQDKLHIAKKSLDNLLFFCREKK